MADSIGVLESVHSFYSDSFSQLITITIAFLVFAGVLMPLMIQFYQSRSLRQDKEYLETLLRTKTEEAKSELETHLATRFAEEQEKIAAIIQKEVSEALAPVERKTERAIGGLFHLQARQIADSERPTLALDSCCEALPAYIRAKDESNLQAVLFILTEQCLPDMNKTNFERDVELEGKINKVIELLKSHNKYGRYSRVVDEIKRELRSAQLREVPAL